MSPGSLPHLVRRFFATIRSRPPTPDDQRFVAARLTDPVLELFHGQQTIDQAHAVAVAHRVQVAAPERSDLVRAALLHDVGKQHSRLGITGRVLASLIDMLRLPGTSRQRRYLEHGRLGARDLESVGEEGVVVAFARHHPGPVPNGVDPEDWALLEAADEE